MQEEAELLGNVFLRDLGDPSWAPIFRGGAASGQKERRIPVCLCLPWTYLVSPPYLPFSPAWLQGGRSALPFKWAHVFFQRSCSVKRVKTRSQCVAPHLCPHHCQTDWYHMACHPGRPRSFPAVWTQWWLPQGNAWHVFNYSLVFSSVSPCSLIVLSSPKKYLFEIL